MENNVFIIQMKTIKDYTILFADMDWCLISTKSGHLFPQSWDDFKIDKQVAESIKRLAPKMVLIVSNQSGVDDKSQPKKYIAKADFERRQAKIMKELSEMTGVPVYGTYCPSADKRNPLRKPNPGMCEKMMKEHCPDEKKENMLMIGDASGLKGDWADTDKKCAINFGIDYMDVDEFVGRPHRDDKFTNIEESLQGTHTLAEYVELYNNIME